MYLCPESMRGHSQDCQGHAKNAERADRQKYRGVRGKTPEPREDPVLVEKPFAPKLNSHVNDKVTEGKGFHERLKSDIEARRENKKKIAKGAMAPAQARAQRDVDFYGQGQIFDPAAGR